MRLDSYTTGSYSPGASLGKQLFWYYLGSPLFSTSWIPFSPFKCLILRWFGAIVGEGVRIKPNVKVKFPWRLVLGDYVWLGENCWIDNISLVTIDSHSCISQDVYLCTGNHDWNDLNFQLIDKPIHIQESCWIAARAVVGPGVTIGKGAVLGLASVASGSLEPMTIYAGNPAQEIKQRKMLRDFQE